MPYLGIFGMEFGIFGISALKFVKYKFLTHVGNFGIDPSLLKFWGPLFLKVRVRSGFALKSMPSNNQKIISSSLIDIE